MGRRVLTALASEVGRDEVMLLLALGLVALGLWQMWAPAACLLPGLILLWMFLPARPAFVVRTDRAPGRAEGKE